MSDGDGWYYDSPNTLAGALQRGLGRGAYRALRDPAAPELVMASLRRDHRWFPLDEREVYLARLVRDLRMPVAPIVDALFAAPDEEADDDNEFGLTVGVLAELGRAGDEDAVDGVRRYVRHGERWLDALQTVGSTWPAEWWDDLRPGVIGRIRAIDPDRVWWRSAPWSAWVARDEAAAGLVEAARRRNRPSRPYAGTSMTDLLGVLRDRARVAEWRPALRELRRRPPESEVLDLVDALLGAGVDGPLIAVLHHLGPLAVPAARGWAVPGHPLYWTALRILAGHGDVPDGPVLLAGLDWLDDRPDDLCGYDVLVRGLASFGGPSARAALPRIRRLWFGPHSMERPDYLAARLEIDPEDASRALVEGLWDCESGVRLLAARHAPLNPLTRKRLSYLRHDPIETPEVRAAAAARLA